MNILRRFRDRARRLLLWAFCISVAFHFTVLPFISWLMRENLKTAQMQQQPVETITLASSALRFDRRPQPLRPSAVHPPTQHAVQAQPQPQPQPIAQRPPPRREIARITKQAPVSVPRVSAQRSDRNSTFAQQLTQQQAQFNKTLARLRQENNPVVSVARAAATPGTMKRYAYDFSGSVGTPLRGEGILTPDKMWRDGPWDYYYVTYWVIYPDGTSETGKVPWPIRFPANADPLKYNNSHLPLAGPLPDYVLPAGTYLRPLVAFCYAHHLSSCPIEHD